MTSPSSDSAQPVTIPSASALRDGMREASSDVARELGRLSQAAVEAGFIEPNNSKQQKKFQNRVVDARLGSAAGLFTAMRCKHPATADHCLRVALTCSGWAASAELTESERDTLEIASLLHDLGKIGIPDALLAKPGRLLSEEAATMSRHRLLACEMLAASGAPQEVLDTVLTAGAWYDGSNQSLLLAGDQIPRTARMLAIVDAFDSMTTDHVYRPAKPRERALAELFDFAGKQFDPELVKEFAKLISSNQRLLTDQVASRWLTNLSATELPKWIPETAPVAPAQPSGDNRTLENNALFEQKLLDSMHDGVIFVDRSRKIYLWNTGAERLTGIASNAVCGRILEPSLLQMSTTDAALISDNECPIEKCLQSGVQTITRVGVLGRSGRHVTIDMHITPVSSDNGVPCGATLLLHDASSETSLEEKCQALHAQVTKDPLTQVANRAEFDRMLALFIEAHLDTDFTCSLIMADIDHFKHINDTFGHQAGDEAIISFASLLKSMCRSGDLVARYGGEEFVVLCADCNNAAAAERAEQMRKAISETSHSMLANHSVTVSFGVTELQAGDTPETMLRRSDRALLQAKDQGRNQVVQLGNGMLEEEPKKGWFSFKPWRGNALIDARLINNVPIEIAIEKLRGFISDRSARILRVNQDQVHLEIHETAPGKKGGGGQSITFLIEIQFSQESEEKTNTAGFAAGEYNKTVAHVTIRPKRERDRRKGHVAERARFLLGSLKAYLMAKEEATEVATK